MYMYTSGLVIHTLYVLKAICTCRIAAAWAGDSRMVLGRQESNEEGQSFVQAVELTEDHKPDNPVECRRINEAGGRVDRLVSGNIGLKHLSCIGGFLSAALLLLCIQQHYQQCHWAFE